MVIELIIYSVVGALGANMQNFHRIDQPSMAVCTQQADNINKTGKALAVCSVKG